MYLILFALLLIIGCLPHLAGEYRSMLVAMEENDDEEEGW